MQRSTFSWPRHKLVVSGQLHAPAALTGKERPVSILYEVGWTPEPVWTIWRNENFYSTGTRTPAPPGRPARSQSLSGLML
jgi:hypothetical protein